MFWRSVVGKLWFTFLLLVSVVLIVLSFLLLEFFENFHVEEAEEDLMQTATKVSVMIEQYADRDLIYETVERVKDPTSKVIIMFGKDDYWISDSDDSHLPTVSADWILQENDLKDVVKKKVDIKKQKEIVNNRDAVMIVGTPLPDKDGAVFVYQSLNIVKETTKQTTHIILLGAGIAIILTTIFAFFLSTRITSPLIKMREGAFELAKGEFNTKVPILTHDEIGELAMAFNRMGRQLKYHINALRQEKEQLYSILSSMADGVITLNRKAQIMISNPPAEKFLQDWYYEHDISSAEKVLPEELNELLADVISSEKETSREIFTQGRNWVVIMSPLYNQTYVRGVVAVIRDMTEERRLDKLREDFIANVSHELRTPISMLQGYSEAIVDDIAESKEEKNELAQIIHEESLRIGRLVNELLDLARMKAGHIHLNKENVALQSFLQRIARKFNGLAFDKNITIDLHLNDEELVLFIDPDRIEQVLTNLIDNAINHTQENGKVVINLYSLDNKVQFSVTDNGSGISQEDLAFVFERFYKADKSRKRTKEKKGTGLGLAIAKNIVEAHQGTISVQSKVNEGTTFSFILPKNSENK